MMKALILQVAWCLFLSGAFKYAQAVCPNGEGWREIGDQCMKVHNANKDWISANDQCKKKSGKLVSLKSTDQQKNFLDAIDKESYWIGAHIPALVFETFFDQCLDGHSFGNASCFQILPEALSWKAAREKCQTSGGKLASIPDEAANTFVALAMKQMADKEDIEMEDGEYFSYWIDGHSDGKTSKFVDSNGNVLTYTNFATSSAAQNGPSCVEAIPGSVDQLLDDLEDQLLDATTAALEEAMEDLTATGLPADAIRPGTSDVPTDDLKSLAPQFNMLPCNERRYAVCEFSLSVTESNETIKPGKENEAKSGVDGREGGKTTVTPSRVSCCDDLTFLQKYSEEALKKKRKGDDHGQSTLLREFVDLKNGHYIFEAGKIATVDGNVTQFELRYCAVGSAEDSPEGTDAADILQLFKWLNGGNTSLLSLGLEDEIGVYNGPCVFVTSADKTWNPSSCAEKHRFVCQYSKTAIREHFCDSDEENKEEWCQDENGLQRLNEMSKSLLADASMKISAEMSSSIVTKLRDIALEAKLVLSKISKWNTNGNSVKNLTSNIVEIASIVMDTEPSLSFENQQDTLKSVIGTLNMLSEDVADAIIRLKSAGQWAANNVSDLSVTSPGIYLRIFAVGNQTSNKSFDEHTRFAPDDEEHIRLILSDSQKNLSDAHGAAFINVQYKGLSRETYKPQSFDTMANDLANSNASEIIFAYNRDRSGENFFAKGRAYTQLATNILTATLRINGTNHPADVRILMSKKTIITEMEVIPDSEMCVFIKEDNDTTGSFMRWSTHGCRLVYSNNLVHDRYHCECNHTTDFAVLLLVYEPSTDILEGHRYSIWVLAIVGHVLSIVCLLISAVLFLALKRDIKSDRTTIHVNLFFALMLANLIMVISQLRSSYRVVSALDDMEEERIDPSCIALTFFSHFLLLSAMFWMLVEGLVIYRKIVVVLSRNNKAFRNVYYLIGWALPLAIAITMVCVGMLTDATYNTEGCWLSISSGMIWAFAGPTILVVLGNAIILTMVIRVAVQTTKRKIARHADLQDSAKSRLTYLKTAVRGLIVLTPLLGVTWTCGLLMFHVAVAYVFVILNAFQGVAIFFLYCVFNPEVRAALDKKIKQYRVRRFTSMIDGKSHHQIDQEGKATANWTKIKLFMRLSFSTTSGRPQEKFNSVKNSSQSLENQPENDVNEHFAEDTSPQPSPFFSPVGGGKRAGMRHSSVSTRSTFLSHQSSSTSSVRDSTSSISPRLKIAKITSKVRPMSSRPSAPRRLFEIRERPSTADATLTRSGSEPPIDDFTDSVQAQSAGLTSKKGVPYCPVVERKRSESLAYSDTELDILQDSSAEDVQSQAESDSGQILHDDVSCGMDNPNFDWELDDEVNSISTITPDGSMEISHDSPKKNDIQNSSVTKAIPFRTISSSQKCDLCCGEYYNVFSDDNPVQLYSNAWTRRMKPKKRLQSAKRRTKVTVARGAICMSRCCPQCHGRGRRNISETSVISNKGRRPYGSKLDVVEFPVFGKDASGRSSSRPDSGESRDSGIPPDDIEYDFEKQFS